MKIQDVAIKGSGKEELGVSCRVRFKVASSLESTSKTRIQFLSLLRAK